MKTYIDVVVSSPDAELPKPETEHKYTILKHAIEEPKIGLFDLWRMKRFIEKSYIALYAKAQEEIIKQKDEERKTKGKKRSKRSKK